MKRLAGARLEWFLVEAKRGTNESVNVGRERDSGIGMDCGRGDGTKIDGSEAG